jgi:hypothetical protein
MRGSNSQRSEPPRISSARPSPSFGWIIQGWVCSGMKASRASGYPTRASSGRTTGPHPLRSLWDLNPRAGSPRLHAFQACAFSHLSQGSICPLCSFQSLHAHPRRGTSKAPRSKIQGPESALSSYSPRTDAAVWLTVPLMRLDHELNMSPTLVDVAYAAQAATRRHPDLTYYVSTVGFEPTPSLATQASAFASLTTRTCA